MKVSVIVCTYNQEDTLAVALDSILSQEVDFDYEVLVADDCSKDNTREVIARYASLYPKRIRPILNSHNKGISGNYFDCIEAAKGEYIADLAGDDEWADTGKLQRQVRMLDSDSDIVLTHGGWRYMHTEGEYSRCPWLNMPEQEEVVDGKKIIPLLLNHSKERYFIHLCTSLYRRDRVISLLHEKGELLRNPEWPCEDYQLEVLLAGCGKIAWQPQMVLNYRVGHSSISSEENNNKNVSFAGKVLKLTRLLTLDSGYSLSINKDYYRKTMHYLAMNTFNSRDKATRKFYLSILKGHLWPYSSGIIPLAVRVLTKNMKVWRFLSKIWDKKRHR